MSFYMENAPGDRKLSTSHVLYSKHTKENNLLKHSDVQFPFHFCQFKCRQYFQIAEYIKTTSQIYFLRVFFICVSNLMILLP